jgi:hypothetical protein
VSAGSLVERIQTKPPARHIRRAAHHFDWQSSSINVGLRDVFNSNHRLEGKVKINESEFLTIAKQEHCRACLDERIIAVSPDYLMYTIQVQKLLTNKTYPAWRTNRDKTLFVGAYETPPTDAFPITYHELALHTGLFAAISFDPEINYLKSQNVIVFHCTSCGIRVVKDGNHRLLQCVVNKYDTEITVYEVSSPDWRRSKVDMKNFCKCISNNWSE